MDEPPRFTRKERAWLTSVFIFGGVLSIGLGLVLGVGAILIGIGVTGLLFAFCDPPSRD
jgi:hypothetical protein